MSKEKDKCNEDKYKDKYKYYKKLYTDLVNNSGKDNKKWDCCDGKHDSHGKKEQGLFTEFQVFQLPINRAGQAAIPISTVTPTELGRITLNLDDASDRVWLNATVGYFSPNTSVITYRIFRNAVVIGTEIFSAIEEVEGGNFENNLINHFSHVDTPQVTGNTPVTYILTAQATVAGPTVIGPVTFTGAEIERNRG